MGRHEAGKRVPPAIIVQPRTERSSPELVQAADEAIQSHQASQSRQSQGSGGTR